MQQNKEKIKIFSGNSNISLAKKVSEELGILLGNMDIKRFKDKEIFLNLNEDVRNFTCFIVQSTCFPANDNLMEMLVMADALKRAGAKKIVAVVPYFGYARQDRKARKNDPITARLVANLMEASGIDGLITVDLHVPQIEGFFNIPVIHLEGQEILINSVKSFLKNTEDYCVVSPDLGAVKKAKKFSSLLDDLPVVIVNKFREKANECEVTEVIGNVENKNLIILDDMIDTAGTITKVADTLSKKGAKKIIACATHAVLSGDAAKRLENSKIGSVFFLDTIPIPKEKNLEKIKVFSTCEAISSAIKDCYINF